MSKTTTLLKKVVKTMMDMDLNRPEPSYSDGRGVETIPTLDPSVQRAATPMLRKRFAFCGAWELATHGDWLSIDEIEALTRGDMTDERLCGIDANRKASTLGWMNDAGGLFLPSRLTYFAGTRNSYERVYLLWLDDKAEPEVWAYDTNGEARYVNLDAYLTAYLADDFAAYDARWHLADLVRR